ncbi:hypothetical protein MMPV_005559 [Pyropia vietnamensis]
MAFVVAGTGLPLRPVATAAPASTFLGCTRPVARRPAVPAYRGAARRRVAATGRPAMTVAGEPSATPTTPSSTGSSSADSAVAPTTTPAAATPPPSSAAGARRRKKKAAKPGLPVVAVIGRPNVGKSTLVNRLAGSFRAGAIVDDVVGITRDRTYRAAEWAGVHYQLVDTGGLVFDDAEGLVFLPEIRAQARVALGEAAAVLVVVDGQAGWNPLDADIVRFLRTEFPQLPVTLAVNKCESDKAAVTQAAEFWSLGIGEPWPVSGIHGSGTGDMLDALIEELPRVPLDDVGNDGTINVAIVGRPNVGKSTLLNVLTNSDRAIVSDVPGTTRDAIDETITIAGQKYKLIDTAGIRRKTAVSFGTEFFMINRAFRAIRRADCVLLVVDVAEGATDQDRKIAERIIDEGKACVILANKWDMVGEKNNRSYKEAVLLTREKLAVIPWAQVELVSALERQRTQRVISMVDAAVEQHRRRVSTATLNEVLRDAIEWHRPPSTKQARQGRVYYCTQVSVQPPTVAMFVNDPRLFSDNYRRYMESTFRKALGFEGSPLRLLWRGKARAPVTN